MSWAQVFHVEIYRRARISKFKKQKAKYCILNIDSVYPPAVFHVSHFDGLCLFCFLCCFVLLAFSSDVSVKYCSNFSNSISQQQTIHDCKPLSINKCLYKKYALDASALTASNISLYHRYLSVNAALRNLYNPACKHTQLQKNLADQLVSVA